MPDDLASTSLFRRLEAPPSALDTSAGNVEAQKAFDDVLSELRARSVSEPNESDARYLARLAETAAAFGPEERKFVDRRKLPSAALAEIARRVWRSPPPAFLSSP